MPLDAWIDAFLDHMRVERAASPHTLAAYARALQAEEDAVIALACEVARAVVGREAAAGEAGADVRR